MLSLLLILAALHLQVPSPQASVAAQVDEVTLSALHASPARKLGRDVRFTVQFQGLAESWEAYLSRFDESRWLALEVWPDELFTWDRDTFEAPLGHLFVRRGGGFEPVARRARTYQRLQIHGRVREVFLGEPWIEVLEITPLEGEVGEGAILHVTRARELLLEGQFSLALEQYERARSSPLPPHALAAVLQEIRYAEEVRVRNKGEAPRAVEDSR